MYVPLILITNIIGYFVCIFSWFSSFWYKVLFTLHCSWNISMGSFSNDVWTLSRHLTLEEIRARKETRLPHILFSYWTLRYTPMAPHLQISILPCSNITSSSNPDYTSCSNHLRLHLPTFGLWQVSIHMSWPCRYYTDCSISSISIFQFYFIFDNFT